MNTLRRILLTVPLLAAALPTSAETSITATNWVAGVPLPGIQYTNSAGQVCLRGNAHTLRVLADDARITGRLVAWMDLAYQTNGTANFSGPAYSEVGDWDLTGTKFTPSGGLWDLTYRGVAQADGSDQVRIMGYGIGGAIDGLRVELTATKGPGAPFDPAIPYYASGTIKPVAVNTSLVVDDFEDGQVDPRWIPWSTDTPQLVETDGQFTVRGISGRRADQLTDHSGGYWNASWSIADGQTMEWRVDIISMNQDASVVGFGVGTSSTRYYMLRLESQSISLYRVFAGNGGIETLLNDPVTIKQTGIVLSFAITRRESRATITICVVEKSAPDKVLYRTSFPDTAPFLVGNNVVLAVGPKPELPSSDAAATFDNLVRRVYDVPSVGIQRGVLLTWPATGTNFGVEAAPTLQGPWLPVPDSRPLGFEQINLLHDDLMKYFRLKKLP